MPITINKSSITINRSSIGINVNITGSSVVLAQLVGYVILTNQFMGACSVTTGTTPTLAVYSYNHGLGQFAFNDTLYRTPTGLSALTDSFGQAYAVANVSGATPFKQVRIGSSGLVDNLGLCQNIGKGYYTVSSTPVNVGNTNRLWSTTDDNLPYVGCFAFATDTGSYFGAGQTIAWADSPSVSAQYMISFDSNNTMTGVTAV